MTIFTATELTILNQCQNANVHMRATSSELEKKEFTVYSQNIKQAIGIQVKFHLQN